MALVGLVLLAVIGWLAGGLGHGGHDDPHHTPATPTTVATKAG